jgi:hypothetical protein
VLPEGRGILRGGYGKFAQRTPLNVDAFASFEPRTVTRFAPLGASSAPGHVTHISAGRLRTPEARSATSSGTSASAAGCCSSSRSWPAGHARVHRGRRIRRGALWLSTEGNSRYREVESTVRYMEGPRRDLTLSYVWATGHGGSQQLRSVLRQLPQPDHPAERARPATDVRHRLLLRGVIGLPGRWDLAPVLELRSGFPWSAVDEFQDFVGPRNRDGRLPAVTTLDFSLVRPWRIGKLRFRAGLRVYNLFGDTAERDIQNNVTSPDYGTAYNPVERSIGIVFGTGR